MFIFRTLVKLPRPPRALPIQKATKQGKNVALQKQPGPLCRHHGGVGGCARVKQWGSRWLKKTAELLLFMLKNTEQFNPDSVSQIIKPKLPFLRNLLNVFFN